MQFFSQVGQDAFLLEHFFRGRRNGVFVDVGAYDGEKFSNTLFFERYMDWRGLCIEDVAHGRGVGDEGDDPDFGAAERAHQWENFIDAGEQQRLGMADGATVASPS